MSVSTVGDDSPTSPEFLKDDVSYFTGETVAPR